MDYGVLISDRAVGALPVKSLQVLRVPGTTNHQYRDEMSIYSIYRYTKARVVGRG